MGWEEVRSERGGQRKRDVRLAARCRARCMRLRPLAFGFSLRLMGFHDFVASYLPGY